jgi:hypothetical protein
MILSAGTASSFMGGITLAVGNVDQFTVAVDPDTINEEIIFVTGVSSDTLTIVRGRAGTSAVTHSGGASVKHVLTSDDLNYYTSGVDNAATITGTQTLTNKTLTSPAISGAVLTGTVTAGGGVGTNGQVLSSTSTGVQWATPSAGYSAPTIGSTSITSGGTFTTLPGVTSVNSSIVPASDTLVGRATTDTLTNKTLTSPAISNSTLTGTVTAGGGVGTSGQVLSSTGTGVQWSAAATDLSFAPMASGFYYGSNEYTGGVLGSTFSANTSYYIPFLVTESTTFSRIAVATATNFSGSADIRMAIYNNGTDMLPSSLVLDAGTAAASAANTTYAVTINQTLAKGWYWLAANTTTAATTNAFQSITSTNFPYNTIFNKTYFTSTVNALGVQTVNVASSYPSSASASWTNTAINVALRKA